MFSIGPEAELALITVSIHATTLPAVPGLEITYQALLASALTTTNLAGSAFVVSNNQAVGLLRTITVRGAILTLSIVGDIFGIFVPRILTGVCPIGI